jgi:hypothetical protein
MERDNCFSRMLGGGLDGGTGRVRGDGGWPQAGGDVLASWAEGLGLRQVASGGRRVLRFVFYGRVSTEDWQDPVSSRARQLQQAVMLTAGHGVIVAEFFDVGESRTLAWARVRRPRRWSRSSPIRTGGGRRS